MNTQACKQFESTRTLDALGELDRRAENHSAWAFHLDVCPACRAEVDGIRKLAEAVRETRFEPSPTEAESRVLARRLVRTLRTERDQQARQGGKADSDLAAAHGLSPRSSVLSPRFGARLPRLVPTLAAAGLILALGWIGFTAYDPAPSPPIHGAAVGPDDRMILRDYEVIRNLDLLQEMETVRKLVQHVDRSDTGPSSSGADETIGRGDLGHEWLV